MPNLTGQNTMQWQPTDEHLSQINTQWTMLFAAHSDSAEREEALRQLVQRYSRAVYCYLLALVRNQDAADELFQEFAVRLVRGDFKRAHPDRGRFRQFLKTSLYHLMIDYQRKKNRQPGTVQADVVEPAGEPDSGTSDREFLEIWRKELLDRTWQALAEVERTTGQPFHSVLRYRTDHPEVRSATMAEHFSRELGKEVNAQWIRKRLFLARERFTDLLVEEVTRSMDNPSETEVEEELADLELLDYCRDALERRRGKTFKS